MIKPTTTAQTGRSMSNHECIEAIRLAQEIATLIEEADPRGGDLIRRIVDLRESSLDLRGENELVKRSESVQLARAMAKGMRNDPERWFGKASPGV